MEEGMTFFDGLPRLKIGNCFALLLINLDPNTARGVSNMEIDIVGCFTNRIQFPICRQTERLNTKLNGDLLNIYR